MFEHGIPLVTIIKDILSNSEMYESNNKPLSKTARKIMKDSSKSASKVTMIGTAAITLWKDKHKKRTKDIVLFAKYKEDRDIMGAIVSNLVDSGNFKLINKRYVAGGIQWVTRRIK